MCIRDSYGGMPNVLTKFRWGKHNIKLVLLRQAKREKNIIFGAQAIKKRLGISARPTFDYDMFSKTPKKSAFTSEKDLDKWIKSNSFYTKKSKHAGTYRVRFVGRDLKPRTDDDIGVADYSKVPKPEPKTFTSGGIKYRSLKEELAAKLRALRNPQFKLRHPKDREDAVRIKRFLRGRK